MRTVVLTQIHTQPRLTARQLFNKAFKMMDFTHKLAALELIVQTPSTDTIDGVGPDIDTTNGVGGVIRLFAARYNVMELLTRQAGKKKVGEHEKEAMIKLRDDIANGTRTRP